MNKSIPLSQFLWSTNTALRQAVLVVAGILVLALSAKIKVMIPYSPVPVTMGTFAVLTLGAAYGPRLGLATILGYMLIGALGFDVFASSSAELSGWHYMAGSTGGYLVGFVLATLLLGHAATRGWDRSVLKMVPVLMAANAVIYGLGMGWLAYLYGFDLQTAFAKGMAPFLLGDGIKLALSALLLPAAWALVKRIKGA